MDWKKLVREGIKKFRSERMLDPIKAHVEIADTYSTVSSVLSHGALRPLSVIFMFLAAKHAREAAEIGEQTKDGMRPPYALVVASILSSTHWVLRGKDALAQKVIEKALSHPKFDDMDDSSVTRAVILAGRINFQLGEEWVAKSHFLSAQAHLRRRRVEGGRDELFMHMWNLFDVAVFYRDHSNEVGKEWAKLKMKEAHDLALRYFPDHAPKILAALKKK